MLGLRIEEAVRENQTATDVFDEALAAFLGINRTDVRCLDIIDRKDKVSAGQLANESGLTTGAVTAVIDRLEAAGYVRRVRDYVDRRKVWVETTPTIKTISRHIFGFYARMSPQLTGRLTEEQMRGIIEFLTLGSYLSREAAAAMSEHLNPPVADTAERVERAKRLEKALAANKPRLEAELAGLLAKVDAELKTGGAGDQAKRDVEKAQIRARLGKTKATAKGLR